MNVKRMWPLVAVFLFMTSGCGSKNSEGQIELPHQTIFKELGITKNFKARKNSPTFATQMVFPIDGEADYSNDFGAPRTGHTHKGNDIFADKHTPVVAVADGIVSWVSKKCCNVFVDHEGGWQSRYIHLNNDTPGTDDGKGHGVAQGIEQGTTVRAGQVIGYVGDSGNAEDTPAHLHFEILFNDKYLNPYNFLIQAL